MSLFWYHNTEKMQWELLRAPRPVDFDDDGVLQFTFGVKENREHVVVCIVDDVFVSGMDLGLEGLHKILNDAHPDWPHFPNKDVRTGKSEDDG